MNKKFRKFSLLGVALIVHGIVEFATINAAAKKRFISNLLKCETKEEIHKLCKDAVIHGMYYHPKAVST